MGNYLISKVPRPGTVVKIAIGGQCINANVYSTIYLLSILGNCLNNEHLTLTYNDKITYFNFQLFIKPVYCSEALTQIHESVVQKFINPFGFPFLRLVLVQISYMLNDKYYDCVVRLIVYPFFSMYNDITSSQFSQKLYMN